MEQPAVPPADCPLCPSNHLLNEPIIARTPAAYLIKAHASSGNYLIIPAQHTEKIEDLPNDWWQSVAELLTHIPHGDSYNISINIGADAGQTQPHVHFWVIPRSGGRAGSGKGLARLVGEAG